MSQTNTESNEQQAEPTEPTEQVVAPESGATPEPTEPTESEVPDVDYSTVDPEELDKYNSPEEFYASLQSDDTGTDSDSDSDSDGEDKQKAEPDNQSADEPEAKPKSESKEETLAPEDAAKLLSAIGEIPTGNGKSITVDNLEEMQLLLRRGVGANKRMQELAPKLKVIEMLESAEVLDPAILNTLIAVNNGDPEAIKSLLAKHDMDPDALLNEEGEMVRDPSYQVPDNSVPENQYQAETILSELSTDPGYEDTVKVIGSLDSTGQAALLNDPPKIRELHSDVNTGVYSQIEAIVERDRLLGNLTGMDSYSAYTHVREKLMGYLEAQGTDDSGHGNQPPPNQSGNLADQGTDTAGHSKTVNSEASTQTTQGSQAAAVAAVSGAAPSRSPGADAPVVDYSQLSPEEIEQLDFNTVFQQR